MKFSHTPLARACTLALGLTLLHGCDSDGEFSEVSNVTQATGNTEFVGLSSQQSSSQDGGGDNGTGDGGDNSGGGDNGTGDGGDNSSGDCANNSCVLGTPSRALAISALEYATSHANLAHFAQALANNGAAAGSYQCIGGGTAIFSAESRSDNHGIPTWAFTDCQLPADSETSLIYNGHLSSVCTRTNRTSNDAVMECTAAFNNLRVASNDHAAAINGTVTLSIDGESLRTDSAGLSTATALDTWTSPSQTIASQGSELRGLNIRVDTLADNLALTILGQGEFRLSAAGCLLSGDVLVGDFYSDATISITGQSGGNMLLNTVATTETIACSEISALPYTAPQFR